MGVLEEARVRPPKYASIVRVERDVDNLLMVGSRDYDGDGDPYFNRCVSGGHHCLCLGVSQEDDKVGELGGVVRADVGDYVCSVGCGSSVGGVLRLSGVTTVSDVRCDTAISMPCVSAWRRYP